MADKKFIFNGRNVVIGDPANRVFTSPFIEETYRYLFGRLPPNGLYEPYINIDTVPNGPQPFDIVARAIHHGEIVPPPNGNPADPVRAQIQFHFRHFLETHPEFFGLLCNLTSSASIAIGNSEFLLGQAVGGQNFIRAKAVIDQVNSLTWSRMRDLSEQQSGNITVGQISEKLLARAMASHLSNEFFQVHGSNVKSYGDFVAVCLPNNLWISVKSNYARERLLASGYSNDIVGAGFFVDAQEFTNPVRIRNFQRAGFLAMYLPDVPVNDEQAAENTSTYQLATESYDDRGVPRPLNINGKLFIRPLSQLSADIGALLAVSPVSNRLTVSF
ncbi:hypothetical protein [Qipengyuania aquimaris]|uniref:hypothetical protein n=1 Tax=Qipengyuania aquimaris TaxID=255984 RepID=UPI001FD096D1|nr:hypothetical protein [Qipengyuania aquimaris]UOR15831.1 hypothetical protein LCM05_01975 [Qipengyuania aquimaris]